MLFCELLTIISLVSAAWKYIPPFVAFKLIELSFVDVDVREISALLIFWEPTPMNLHIYKN